MISLVHDLVLKLQTDSAVQCFNVNPSLRLTVSGQERSAEFLKGPQTQRVRSWKQNPPSFSSGALGHKQILSLGSEMTQIKPEGNKNTINSRVIIH